MSAPRPATSHVALACRTCGHAPADHAPAVALGSGAYGACFALTCSCVQYQAA